MTLGFTISHTDGRARRGTITTAHGTVQTPAFMPVGTAATVKAMTFEQVKSTGAEVVLGNTYHLMLRPGADRIERLGGLHEFMGWDKTILTDSGGFQVMSLGALRTLTEQGVEFKSHLDGAKYMLTPERAITIQQQLDSNITMVLDECTAYPATEEQANSSMQLSMRWAQRCRDAFKDREGYGLFGIVQGSTFPELREESAKKLIEIGFDGYAIGGLAVGEGQAEMLRMRDVTEPHMLTDKPRYLMGVGNPSDLVESVRRGVDMFDCVIPTRSGRFGRAYTSGGEVNLKNARHADDSRPLAPEINCPASQTSRAYLHHLIRCDEMLGATLLSWHNVAYYQHLMQQMRDAIERGDFDKFTVQFHAREQAGDIAPI
jgi:queuine tRNA-ribosyltransferase